MNLAEKFKSFDEEEVNEGSLLNFMGIDGLKTRDEKNSWHCLKKHMVNAKKL